MVYDNKKRTRQRFFCGVSSDFFSSCSPVGFAVFGRIDAREERGASFSIACRMSINIAFPRFVCWWLRKSTMWLSGVVMDEDPTVAARLTSFFRPAVRALAVLGCCFIETVRRAKGMRRGGSTGAGGGSSMRETCAISVYLRAYEC